MRRRQLQRGVTLIEVLVGFVIFTSSLVAVLGYVGEQIFHTHRASANLQRIQRIYETSQSFDRDALREASASDAGAEYTWLVSATTMDQLENSTEPLSLVRYDYSVADRQNTMTWSVLHLE
jgi:Tfp pilus assembly protein PilV